MSDIRDFIEKMKTEIKNYLPDDIYKDVIIEDIEIVKINDQKLHGLTIRMPESNVAPTLYVDDMYQAYRDGAYIGYLATELANMYTSAWQNPYLPLDGYKFDIQYDKNVLGIRLMEGKRNREFLSDKPYKDVGNGLAVIADINMGETKGGDWRIAVNNSVLEQMGIDKETLFADAMKNSAKIEPPTLVDMSSALFSSERINLLDRNEPVKPEDIGSMYVLTNASGYMGAAVLFYPGVKEKIGDLLGSYYVLPSSLHELIIVPTATGIETIELQKMVKKANEDIVEEKEILSYDVFFYDSASKTLKECR